MADDSAKILKTMSDSIDKTISSISGLAEGYAKPYLGMIAGQLWHDLDASGFEIDRKKTGPTFTEGEPLMHGVGGIDYTFDTWMGRQLHNFLRTIGSGNS